MTSLCACIYLNTYTRVVVKAGLHGLGTMDWMLEGFVEEGGYKSGCTSCSLVYFITDIDSITTHKLSFPPPYLVCPEGRFNIRPLFVAY